MLAETHQYFRDRTASWEMPRVAWPWFWGHEHADWQLVPSILRKGNQQHEFHLTKRFRLLAPGFGVQIDTERLDQWLFLMQHHRAPTRLLDWSESLNTAIFFACLDWIRYQDVAKCSDGAIVCLNPAYLNEQVLGEADFPLTWVEGRVFQTIKLAFGTPHDEPVDGDDPRVLPLATPVAVFPSTVHGRMRAQKACFTLHGTDHRDLRLIMRDGGWDPAKVLIEFTIPGGRKPELIEDLALAGTTASTIFPDLEGLATDLTFQFGIVPERR